jgi:hypothetical protein
MLWQSRESLIAATVVPVLHFDAGTQEQIAIDRSLEPRLTTVEITPGVVYAAPLQSQRRVPERYHALTRGLRDLGRAGLT